MGIDREPFLAYARLRASQEAPTAPAKYPHIIIVLIELLLELVMMLLSHFLLLILIRRTYSLYEAPQCAGRRRS